MAKHRRDEGDPFEDLRSDFMLPASVGELRLLCEEVGDCWIFPKTGAFPCHLPGTTGSLVEAPRNFPHRWAWMLANDRAHQGLPSNVAVRRRCPHEAGCERSANCIHSLCCNPAHLYITPSGGKDELPAADLGRFIAGEINSSLIFGEDLSAISSMCDIDRDTACWLPAKQAVACRADGDERDYLSLPRLSPHRWTWAVANGCASNPLPSNMFHVRRRCARSTCCNPDHLFLTALDGTELTLLQAEVLLAAGPSGWQEVMEAAGWTESLPPVLGENLDEIAALCEVDAETHCWQFNGQAAVSCRANGDTRARSELPKLLPHRWVWAVANRRVGDRLLGNHLQIRRSCGETRCCSPEHLYPTLLSGRRVTLEEIDKLGALDESPEKARSKNFKMQGATVLESKGPKEVRTQAAIDIAPLANHSGSSASPNGSVIRSSYASWISASCPALDAVADALAVAIHPWPQFSLGEPLIDAVVAELHPLANIQHPDVCEVAADRLLRISDVATELECPDLAKTCYEAANNLHLLTPLSPKVIAECSDIIAPLLAGRVGIGVASNQVGARQASEDDWDEENFEELYWKDWGIYPSPAERALAPMLSADGVGALLPKIAAAASRDLGVLLGGQAVDFDVAGLIKGSPELAVLRNFADHLASLSDRDRDIIVDRHFNLGTPQTLDSLGDRWGITRERVRQIARKADDRLEAELGAELRAISKIVLGPLRHSVLPTRDLFDLVGLVVPSGITSDAVVAALIRADGTWSHDDGWSMTLSQEGMLSASVETLMDLADGYWSVATVNAQHYLLGHFLRSEHLEKYLTERLGWVQVKDRWSLNNSKRSRIATALRAIGRPATKSEIAQGAGIKEINQISNQLGNIPDVVRADKDRWAFAGWVEDPYDGIVGEIEQRIDEYGGAVSFELLLSEIPARFGVSAYSVRTFVATDAFVLDHGMVSRNEAEYQAGDPTGQINAVRVGARWGQRVMIHQRHFEGYSMAVSFDIAYANGLRPGDDLMVPIVDSGEKASLIWQRHNPSRTVFVGRVSRVLADLGCSAGEGVVIVPSAEDVQILSEHEALASGPSGVAPEESRIDIAPALTSSGEIRTREDSVRDPLLDLLGDD